MELGNKNTILVVNDTPDQLELMSALLGKAGYRVVTAGNGRDGFRVAQREHPDAVVSDVMMPGTSGIELCRLVRADAQLRTTPILLVSAVRVDTASAVEGLKAGADDYLEIPFDPMHLIAKVTRLAERAEAEKALRESEERYRLLVESVKDYAIFMLDIEGRVASWNAGAERLKGYSTEEIIGSHFSRFYTAEDIQNGKPAQALATAATEGRFEDEGWHVRQDGSRFWANVVITALKDEAGHLCGFSEVTRDISERKVYEDRLAHEASHDALTGLPNRALFIEHLKHAIALARRHPDYLFAVLFLDLDRFKVINDSLGHTTADQLLVEIAHKLRAVLRPEDIVARLGGDEFTILLDDIEEVSDATRVATRINEALSAPFNLGGHEVFTTTSIGIALSSGECAQPEDCLRDADTAMYRAKAAGTGHYEIFDQSMHEQVMRLLKLETDLRRAIERREFRIYYQPIVELANDKVVGFEALVRWQHPERGLLAPADFITVAEETGLIIPIGEWILREACRQLCCWQREFSADPPLAMSVNLCAKQFAQPDLTERIDRILHEESVAAGSLKLEVTESVVMESDGAAPAVLLQLRGLGVKLHIDDFGTGYSSLSYLHRFPIDTLKIDRSFVSRMNAEDGNMEIVRTIVQLAHNLKMEVMAEGIETEEQLAALRVLGCEYGQGYFFSEPVKAEAAKALIKL